MYRSFLSWRYLFARPTNLIGMVGILVAVFALILILSIMTGFLDESRKTVRGNLSDVMILPRQVRGPSIEVPRDPDPILDVVRSDGRVAGAAAQLVWGAMVTIEGQRLDHRLAFQGGRSELVVQLIGIDVPGQAWLARQQFRVHAAQFGPAPPAPALRGEYDVTRLLPSLTGEEAGPPWAPVANPLLPFAPPPGYDIPGRLRASVILGDQLLDELNLRRGDVLQLTTIVQDELTGEYAPSNREFVVAGSFRTGENESDRTRLLMDRRELSDFLGGSVRYSQVLVRLENYERDKRPFVAEILAELEERELLLRREIAGTQILTWEDFRGNLLGAIENERALMAIMLSLVLLVAGFTIFAILSMMVTEKRRDIGILLALGATPRGILDMFVMIAFWDALWGTLFGATLGVWAAFKIDPIERWLSDFFGVQIFDRTVYLFDHIPAIVEPVPVAMIVVGAFLCALVFAAFPAWRAARLQPLEGLRYE